jgi:heavy metal sensor kinase
LLAELVVPQQDPAPGDSGIFFGIWLGNGKVLKASDLPEPTANWGMPEVARASYPWISERGDYREAVMSGPLGTRIRVGKSVAREKAELWTFAWQLAGAGAVVLGIGLAGGWLVSARILRPVATISRTASAISATNLSGRIDPETVDRELEDLARVLNAMFDRLEAAFERQARFTADASHELRTPLAIIRSHAELALSRARTADEYQETIEACLRASSRMTGLVDGLLTLARADAGKLDLRREPVDLKGIVDDNVALFRPLAQEKGISLATSAPPALVMGDASRLGQVVTNLLSNAVQYNRPGGEVRVELVTKSGEATLSVADTGRGIPADDCPHIFERFYRVDKARSRASGGNGLGLAICKSIVSAHGGTIGFETELNRGSTFWVRLPAATVL